jgi:glycerol-3-phosphate acyltransferase PlsY
MVAILTARTWAAGGRVHRWRIYILWAAFLTVVAGWPISTWVSELRADRFSSDSGIASAARAAFGPWHLVSLALSFVTVTLAGIALALAAKLPNGPATSADASKGSPGLSA